MKSFPGLLLLSLAAAALSACGGSATATLQLKNGTPTSLTALDSSERQALTNNPDSYVPPASLKLKVIAAYLSENVDPATQNNTGNTQMFYMNSECHENISACNADNLTTFFDFSDPTAANAALNSQGRSIDVGTYRYVRLEFCKYGATGNVKVKGTYTGATELTVTYGGCGETSAEISPPLELKKGDSVKIQIAYDLTHTINVQNGTTTTQSSCAVDSGAGKVVCLGGLNFNPSVVK